MRWGGALARPVSGRTASAAVVLLLVGLALTACVNRNTATLRLEVRDGRESTRYYSTDVVPGETFELHYIHSVSKSPVFGGFQVTTDGQMQPLYTIYRAHGPGLPWPADEHTRTPDGALQITHESEPPRDEIRVWVSKLTADRLEIHDDVVELSEGSDQPRLVVIRVRD